MTPLALNVNPSTRKWSVLNLFQTKLWCSETIGIDMSNLRHVSDLSSTFAKLWCNGATGINMSTLSDSSAICHTWPPSASTTITMFQISENTGVNTSIHSDLWCQPPITKGDITMFWSHDNSLNILRSEKQPVSESVEVRETASVSPQRSEKQPVSVQRGQKSSQCLNL